MLARIRFELKNGVTVLDVKQKGSLLGRRSGPEKVPNVKRGKGLLMRKRLQSDQIGEIPITAAVANKSSSKCMLVPRRDALVGVVGNDASLMRSSTRSLHGLSHPLPP